MTENVLTLGSLFDGSGGFPLGGMLAGIKPIWASEIEPFPIRVTTKRLPEIKHYGDINKLNGADLEPVDIITFGSPCFPAGTLVLTDKGYKDIKDIRVGDAVLTHKGRWRKVTDIGSKESKTVILKGNHYGLECTPNHPIYSASVENHYPTNPDGSRPVYRSVSAEKEWISAEKMDGRIWATPLTVEKLPIPDTGKPSTYKENSFPEMDENFFYFIGRWLGDGWVRDSQRSDRPEGQTFSTIIVCDSFDKEDELCETVEPISKHYSIERGKTGVKIKFTNKLLCHWLSENFGKKAKGKTIPSWVFGLDRPFREALLNGILDSDGYQINTGSYKISTISKPLAFGIRTLAETLDYLTTVYLTKTTPTTFIEGRLVNQNDYYTVQITKSDAKRKLTDECHSWYKVRSVNETDLVQTVYNLTVDEDNSYIADSIVVHNCQDLSHAGKRVGIQGSRSSLFFEAVRVIKEMRKATNGKYPRFIVWENVSGARSSNKGKDFQEVLKQICSIKEGEVSIPEPDKGKWLAAGEIVGDSFSVAWRQLDAVNWGVPQRRKRIYLVADFASRGGAGKILFESEGLSRYSPQSFKTWQTITRCSETGSGNASELCLNDQGGSCIDVSHNITGTLRAEMHGHQPVVLQENKDETVVYGISGYQSNAMKSANPNSGIYEAESARTLDLNGGNPNCNQGGMMICSPYPAQPKNYLFENHGQDSRYKGPLDKAPTVWAGYGTGGTNRPFVVTENQGPTYALHHGGFPYWNKDVSPTLTDRDCKDPTVINQPKTLLFGQHKQGAIYTGPLDVCSTIMAAFGEGGNNTPIVVHEDE